MSDDECTSLRLLKSTRDRLYALGRKNESADALLNRLMDNQKEE